MKNNKNKKNQPVVEEKKIEVPEELLLNLGKILIGLGVTNTVTKIPAILRNINNYEQIKPILTSITEVTAGTFGGAVMLFGMVDRNKKAD